MDSVELTEMIEQMIRKRIISLSLLKEGPDNLRASEPCEADVRGTQVSLKSTPVSLSSTQVSLNSSPVSLTVSIYVGGCSCLACFVHASHVCLACLARLARMARTFGSLARWLAHWQHS